MLVTKQLLVTTDFHSIFSHTVEVYGYQQLTGYLHSSKYYFWVNYAFKLNHGLITNYMYNILIQYLVILWNDCTETIKWKQNLFYKFTTEFYIIKT